MKTASVTVLMSVYNGELYISDQIDSILSQSDVDVYLYIRNDGSTDSTREIVDDYCRRFSNVIGLHEENVGIRDSFLSMFRSAPFKTDYYAFSDADDLWYPEKLKAATSVLSKSDSRRPAGYASQTTIADSHLSIKGPAAQVRKAPSIANAILECSMPGATCVVNRAAKDKLAELDYSAAIIHDSWLYLVVSALGTVVHDPRSFILYRHHGANADGGVHSFRKRWLARLDRRQHIRAHIRQASSLLQQAGNEMPPDSRRTIELFVNSASSKRALLRFLKAKRWYMQNRLSEGLLVLNLMRGV